MRVGPRRRFWLVACVWLAIGGCDVFYPPLSVRDAPAEDSPQSGLTNCGGRLVLLPLDSNNCGSCGNVCPATHEACLGGRCCDGLSCL